MFNTTKSNNEVIVKIEPDDLTKEEKERKSEIHRIKDILYNVPRRAEIGCCVKINAELLLEPECVERMKTPYIYGIITNIEDQCEYTSSKAFQVDWSYDHLFLGNDYLAFCAPQFEHDMYIVKFEEEEDDNEDNEFTRQVTKFKGKWQLVEMLTCEYCDEKNCDRCVYRDELDDKLDAVELEDGQTNEKRYRMYRAFTFWKHGLMGPKMREEIDECVVEHITSRFPVEAGKRKRGFVPVMNTKE